MSWLEMTPKDVVVSSDRAGSAKPGWLKMLKKSAENVMRTRSVMAVVLPIEESRFQKPRPRRLPRAEPGVLAEQERPQ